MTPETIPAETMKAIAEFVTGETCTLHTGSYHSGLPWMEIWVRGADHPHAYFWRPKLDGGDREKAQALDVILAALNLEETAELSKRDYGNWQFINQDPEYFHVKVGGAIANNILQASLLAIAQHLKQG